MKPVVLFDPAFRKISPTFGERNVEKMRSFCDLRWGRDEECPAEEVERLAPDVEVIIGGWWRYGHPSRFPKLRAFMEAGGGLPSPSSMDYRFAFANQIRVLSCAPAFGPMVAEMGLGLALCGARRIALTDREFRSATEPWSHSEFRGEFTLYGKRVGFIGYGGLARSLRKLLTPWEVDLHVYDPWMTSTYLRQQGMQPISLEDLMATCQVIFVLAVPTGSNKALIDRTLLSSIRSDAVFVLLSRAHLVDFDALTEFVLEGRFFAGIDVFPEEPVSADHPIRTADHAILSSHRAGAQTESIRAIGDLITRDLEAVIAGMPPREMQSAEWEYLQLRGNA